MKKTITKILASLMIMTSVMVFAAPALAQSNGTFPEAKDAGIFTGVHEQCYINGTCDICDILIVLITIADWIMRIFAILATIFFVYGAGWMMLSGGNTNYIQKGKDAMKAAIIGSIIILLSFQMTSLVVLLVAEDNDVFSDRKAQDGTTGLKASDFVKGWYTVSSTCKNKDRTFVEELVGSTKKK